MSFISKCFLIQIHRKAVYMCFYISSTKLPFFNNNRIRIVLYFNNLFVSICSVMIVQCVLMKKTGICHSQLKKNHMYSKYMSFYLFNLNVFFCPQNLMYQESQSVYMCELFLTRSLSAGTLLLIVLSWCGATP